MPFPASGAVSLSDVNTSLGYSATQTISLGDVATSAVAGGIPGGTTSMDNLHYKFTGTLQTTLTFTKAGQIYAVYTALSADGNTLAAVANYAGGAAQNIYVWVRSGTTWSLQTSSLSFSGHTGTNAQVPSGGLAISADGNTIACGLYRHNSDQGGLWIFTRSGSTWSQQAGPLTGNDSVGSTPSQGWSVGLSADGNTAISGGYNDGTNALGAVWVFTRSGSTWSQQGSKLVGTGAPVTYGIRQGYQVRISADGNTIASGSYAADSNEGAVWIFTRSGSTWTQQGSRLNPSNVISRSTSTQMAYVGGLNANGSMFAAYGNESGLDGSGSNITWLTNFVFTRSGSTWSQQTKITPDYTLGGGAVTSISADGQIIAIRESGNITAVWTRPSGSSTWTKIFSDTYASFTYPLAALSSNGNTVAVGYRTNSDLTTGIVKVYV